MALILRGQRIEVPGLAVISWEDDPRVAHSTRDVRRASPPQGILLHSFGSRSFQGVVPGAGTVTEFRHIAGQVNTNREGTSEDFMVLVDGRVLQYEDPYDRATYHGSSLNNRYLGIEIQQGTNGVIYAASIEAAVKLIDALTEKLGIQRQIPWKPGAPGTPGTPERHTLQRFRKPEVGGGYGQDYNGVLGHRNADDNRGDPGDGIMLALKAAGYEGFDLGANADKVAWRERQAQLGVPVTGIAGPETVAALKQNASLGKPDGLWVVRAANAAPVVPGGGLVGGTPDPRTGESTTSAASSGGAWVWIVGALVLLAGGTAVAVRARRTGRGNPEPTRLYAPVPGHPGRKRYGALRAFEATGTIDDHDGRGAHGDLFRHEFTPRAAPHLDFDARGRLHFSGGRYTVTRHGVEDRPAARSNTMFRPYRANAGLSVSAGLGAGTVLLAVAGGVALQYGAQLGLNYALRPAANADAKTVRMRVLLREVILGVGFAGLTVGAVAMGKPLAAVVFGVGTASVAGRNLARTDTGQKFLQKLGEYMTASRLPAIPPTAGTGAVDGYGLPGGATAGAFSDTLRKLQAVG